MFTILEYCLIIHMSIVVLTTGNSSKQNPSLLGEVTPIWTITAIVLCLHTFPALTGPYRPDCSSIRVHMVYCIEVLRIEVP